MGKTPVPYGLFVLSGMTLWQLFADSIQAPMRMISQSTSMLTKVKFPREALIVAAAGEVVFAFFIRLSLLIPCLIWFRVSIDWPILLVPVGVLALIFLGMGLGMLLTPLAILYHDVSQGLPFLISLWMFATPVLYPSTNSDAGSLMAKINPAAVLLDTTRAWILTTPPEWIDEFFWICAATAVTVVAGWLFYRLALPVLIERMSG